jgi:dCMP deaminase
MAARRGISLEGKSMYVTTFPCPACGKLVAFSGIKNIYFKDGYAMLDSEDILKSQGVGIFQVQF